MRTAPIAAILGLSLLAAAPTDPMSLAREEGRVRAVIDVCATTSQKPQLLNLSSRFLRSLSITSDKPVADLEAQAALAKLATLGAGAGDKSKCVTALPKVIEELQTREKAVEPVLAR